MLTAQRYAFFVILFVAIYYCYKLGTHALMHFNFRLVMCSAAVYAVLFSASRLLMYELLSRTAEVEDRTVANSCCLVLGVVHSASIGALIASMGMVGLERHLASVYVCNYQQKGQRRIGIWMVVGTFVIWTLLSCGFNYLYLDGLFDLKRTYQTCLCQFALFKRNQRTASSRIGLDPLAVRFQQTENVHTTKLIVPVFIVYLAMCLLGLACSTLRYRLMQEGDLPTAKVVMQIGYQSIDVCVLFCMIFTLLFHPGLRLCVLRDVCRLFCLDPGHFDRKRRRKVTSVQNEGAVYFHQLEVCWR
ncbi:hypothetical protein M3Y99_01269300 [Aphelenchoides fujianensis]|nr:hypothetical protein M3Y99_01269300 [Aphelenchoides fujianensis]